MEAETRRDDWESSHADVGLLVALRSVTDTRSSKLWLLGMPFGR